MFSKKKGLYGIYNSNTKKNISEGIKYIYLYDWDLFISEKDTIIGDYKSIIYNLYNPAGKLICKNIGGEKEYHGEFYTSANSRFEIESDSSHTIFILGASNFKKGVIDINGKIILPFIYHAIKFSENGKNLIATNTNDKGELIEEIIFDKTGALIKKTE